MSVPYNNGLSKSNGIQLQSVANRTQHSKVKKTNPGSSLSKVKPSGKNATNKTTTNKTTIDKTTKSSVPTSVIVSTHDRTMRGATEGSISKLNSADREKLFNPIFPMLNFVANRFKNRSDDLSVESDDSLCSEDTLSTCESATLPDRDDDISLLYEYEDAMKKFDTDDFQKQFHDRATGMAISSHGGYDLFSGEFKMPKNVRIRTYQVVGEGLKQNDALAIELGLTGYVKAKVDEYVETVYDAGDRMLNFDLSPLNTVCDDETDTTCSEDIDDDWVELKDSIRFFDYTSLSDVVTGISQYLSHGKKLNRGVFRNPDVVEKNLKPYKGKKITLDFSACQSYHSSEKLDENPRGYIRENIKRLGELVIGAYNRYGRRIPKRYKEVFRERIKSLRSDIQKKRGELSDPDYYKRSLKVIEGLIRENRTELWELPGKSDELYEYFFGHEFIPEEE